jgi:cytochrome c oxidase subunit 2
VGTADDIQIVNDLHLPVNEEIVLSIKSADVLHSFFLPNMRVKQDVVPGMKQYVWFQPTKIGVYDIVCAELCGWGHYKMRGRLTVESREKFDGWLAQKNGEQNQATFTPPPAELE